MIFTKKNRFLNQIFLAYPLVSFKKFGQFGYAVWPSIANIYMNICINIFIWAKNVIRRYVNSAVLKTYDIFNIKCNIVNGTSRWSNENQKCWPQYNEPNKEIQYGTPVKWIQFGN